MEGIHHPLLAHRPLDKQPYEMENRALHLESNKIMSLYAKYTPTLKPIWKSKSPTSISQFYNNPAPKQKAGPPLFTRTPVAASIPEQRTCGDHTPSGGDGSSRAGLDTTVGSSANANRRTERALPLHISLTHSRLY